MCQSHNILCNFPCNFAATVGENQSETHIYSARHLIGFRQRFLQKVTWIVALCILTFKITSVAYIVLIWNFANSTPRWFPSYLILTLLLYFLFISYLPWFTLAYFPSISSEASFPFLSNNDSWYQPLVSLILTGAIDVVIATPFHFYLVIEQQLI